MGVDAVCTETLSRTIPAACSSSTIALLLGTCWTECDDEGRRPREASCALTDATEFATEFFLARADSGRSEAPAIVLLIAKFAARGDGAGGGEYGGS
jgi:hypothetical protein